MKTIILGLGNTILSDDGVGIYVARELKDIISKSQTLDCLAAIRGDNISFLEASVGGFNFIDILSGFDRAVIIDAIHSKNNIPGEFYELDPASLKPTARISSLHGIDFATATDLAKKMGVDFPGEIKIYVMEVKDEFTFGEECTPEVEAEIKPMATRVYLQLKKINWI